jgi:YhgE/Pip-like protein
MPSETTPAHQDQEPPAGRGTAAPRVTAGAMLSQPAVWLSPVVIGAALFALISVVYLGVIVNPTSHLRGLPVVIVNEDTAVRTQAGPVDLGREITAKLLSTPAVSDRLAFTVTSLGGAKESMDSDGAYAALIIPPHFSADVTALAGAAYPRGQAPALPALTMLTNVRAGSLGVSLATGVLQPAVAALSLQLGTRLVHTASPAVTAYAPARALLANPVGLVSSSYRPLPANAGLGQTPFFIALFVVLCGFIGAILINSAFDSFIGYAITEIGPVWRLRPPEQITRWHTLLAKWAIAAVTAPILVAVVLAVAAGALGMDAPHLFELWLFGSYAAATIAIGTLALTAALGTLGQLVGLLVFVYISLASSGGTIPLQAVPGVYQFFANFEPLRQILGGTRAILYFNAIGNAGLNRGLILITIGLAVGLVIGAAATLWYDHTGRSRIQPRPASATAPADRAGITSTG